MPDGDFRYFEFGEFRLDAQQRVLQRNGETIHLTPRIFNLLYVMVENAGRVLEHDELLDKVWEGAFVEQANVKKSISTLRQILGEANGAGEFITTIPRRGYRFTAPVRTSSGERETLLIRETVAEISIEEEIEDAPPVENVSPLALTTGKPRSSQIRRIVFAFVAVLILATVAFAAWTFWRKPTKRFSVEDTRVTRLVSAGNVFGGTLSPDGNLAVYLVIDKLNKSLWVKQAATGSTVQIVPPMNASFWFVTFTPDSQHIYFYLSNWDDPAKNGIYRVSTLGGVLQFITEKNYTELKFSPDGKRLAACHTFIDNGKERHELVTINPDGSDERKIADLPLYSLYRGIAWSPDGSSLLYAVKKQGAFDKATTYIAEVPVIGGSEKIIIPEQGNLLHVAEWLPDKNSFLLLQREANAEIYQIWQYFPSTGEMQRVTNDDYSYTSVSVTRDGKTIGAFRGFGLTSIWLADDKYDFRQVVSGTAAFYLVEWTGDGRLVFSTTENAKEFIGIMNADGSEKSLLTSGTDGIRLYPTVSRDGKHVVFMSERSGGKQAWRIDLDGRNATQLTNLEGINEAKLLSDGQTLIYTAYLKTGTWCLLKRTADGKTLQLTDTDTVEWDISPDEKYMAIYAKDETTKKYRIYVREIESGSTIETLGSENMPGLRWTRDGKALTYFRFRNDVYEIVLQPLDGAERILTTVHGESIRSLDWSPDGKRLAIVRGKNQNDVISISNKTND